MVTQFNPFSAFHQLKLQKKLKIQHGGGRRLQKSANRNISVTF